MRKLLVFVVIALAGAVAIARTVNDDKVSAPHDCAKDDTLVINSNHDSFELTGTCAEVRINGNFATIHGSAQRIVVNGNDNTVHAETVGELSVQGNRNTVTWKAGVKRGAARHQPRQEQLGRATEVARRSTARAVLVHPHVARAEGRYGCCIAVARARAGCGVQARYELGPAARPGVAGSKGSRARAGHHRPAASGAPRRWRVQPPRANVPGMGGTGGGNDPHGGAPTSEKTSPRSLDKLADGRYQLGPFAFKLPDGWVVKPVTSTMRVADLQMGSDADMIVYYFGEGGAGSVQDNVNRWLGQMSQPDGKSSKDAAKIEAMKVAGQDATVVTATGSYGAESMMAGQGPTSIADAEMVAAIIASPMGPFTFKAVGPRAIVDANLAKWKGMLASFTLHDAGSAAAPAGAGW